MKIQSLKIILTLGAVGGLALLALSKANIGFVPGLTMAVGYTAVAILVALAARDYRVGSKTSLSR